MVYPHQKKKEGRPFLIKKNYYSGQKRPVVIYRMLTAGTLEEKMYQRQLTKLALSATVMVSESNCF